MLKRLKKLFIVCLVLFLFVAGSLVADKYSYYLYVFGEYIGVHCAEVAVQATRPDDLTEFTVAELQENENISWDQSLMLVNTEYRLDDVYVPAISQYKESGVYMNDCMKAAYQELSLAVTEETGSKLYVSSDFRTEEKQQELYEADPATATETGASEHQTGLALDVYVSQYAGDGFIQSEAGRFVNSNSWKYGFIIRYPVFGETETGIRYEPWHIRYVGQPHASVIYNNHLTMEEYVDSMDIGQWYAVDSYQISRQKVSSKDTLLLPAEFEQAIISPDNTGSYIITIIEEDDSQRADD